MEVILTKYSVGRELDQRIAEILGWTNLRKSNSWKNNSSEGWSVWKELIGTTPDGRDQHRVPDFSVSDLEALEIAGKYSFAVRKLENRWYARTIWQEDDEEIEMRFFYKSAYPTFAGAICLLLIQVVPK